MSKEEISKKEMSKEENVCYQGNTPAEPNTKILIDELNEADIDTDKIVQKPKVKRILTEKQKEAVAINLAKGREKRDLNRKLKAEEDKKQAEELIAKKVEQVIKTKKTKESKLKKLIGLDEQIKSESESENEIVIVKKKKSKPKKTIIYRDESDYSPDEKLIIKSKKQEYKPEPIKQESIKAKSNISLKFV